MPDLRREFVWTDSVAMGVILVLVGLAVWLGALAGFLPSLLGAFLVGVVIIALGIVLVRQGMRLRPHAKSKSLQTPARPRYPAAARPQQNR